MTTKPPGDPGNVSSETQRNAREWDERYGGAEQVWSGEPNATLAAETAGLAPGRALPGDRGFDLVSAQYPALRRTPGADAERALVRAVGPRGHLLVVHHVLDDAAIEQARAHGFDPTDYVGPRDVAAVLDDRWEIEFDERRPRSATTGAGAHHAADVVLHARRPR